MVPLSKPYLKLKKHVINVWERELTAQKVSKYVDLVQEKASLWSKDEICMDSLKSFRESVLIVKEQVNLSQQNAPFVKETKLTMS